MMSNSAYSLSAAIPEATTESMGEWEDLEKATGDFNEVLEVIRNEHPCEDEYDVTNAVHLANEAFAHFCDQMGDAANTIAWVRSRI